MKTFEAKLSVNVLIEFRMLKEFTKSIKLVQIIKLLINTSVRRNQKQIKLQETLNLAEIIENQSSKFVKKN